MNRLPGPASLLESRAFRAQGPGFPRCGAVAQLGERRVRNAEVEGSIPFRSTIHGLAPGIQTGSSTREKSSHVLAVRGAGLRPHPKVETQDLESHVVTTIFPICSFDSRNRCASTTRASLNVRAITGFSCPSANPRRISSFARAKRSGMVPDRRCHPAADAQVLERRGPVRVHGRLAAQTAIDEQSVPSTAMASRACRTYGPPTGSNTMRAPLPPVIFMTSATRSVSSVAITCFAP